jgi:RNA polymerase sigma-70 factor (ECF subfamily)
MRDPQRRKRFADLEARIGRLVELGQPEEAATLIVKGYGPHLLGFLVAAMQSEDAAYEVFSQFCEDLWRSLGDFRRECTFKTWAYKLAWHAAKRFDRDLFHRRVRRLETSEMSRLAQETRDSTVPYLKTTSKNRLAKLREKLEPEERTLLILRVDRRLPWRDVAHVLSETDKAADEQTLWKRFERIKDKLRRMAQAEGLLS